MQQWNDYFDLLSQKGLYSPMEEHGSCGVGLVADINGTRSRMVVEAGITALKSLWHRGAVDADGKTGDGAGILLQIPATFFGQKVEHSGHQLKPGTIAVGVVFLPRIDFAAQESCRTIVESEIIRSGYQLYGWRQVPVDVSVIGDKGKQTRPEIEHLLVGCPIEKTPEQIEIDLFLMRRRIEKVVTLENINDFYICSFSAQTIIYKGMFRAEQLSAFYPDLLDPLFISSFVIYHQRYSTNTFPRWSLAQPFRMLAHNGEINTLKGNLNWVKTIEPQLFSPAFGEGNNDISPIIQAGSSDSAALDAVFEIIVRGGRTAPLAKAMLIPEAFQRNYHLQDPDYHLHTYCDSIMRPWDGPAAIAATDGRWLVAGTDRNGLRPLRYSLTEDGLLVIGSEAGMVPLNETRIKEKGNIGPGKMIAVDLKSGKFYRSKEIIRKLALEEPYKSWTALIKPFFFHPPSGQKAVDENGVKKFLTKHQILAGYSHESVDNTLRTMVLTAKEPIGSMGDDARLAVLSAHYRGLHHYFRQNFSQVTNPPIDSLREYQVMSLRTYVGNVTNVLEEACIQNEILELQSPVLTNDEFNQLNQYFGKDTHFIHTIFEPEKNDKALEIALQEIQQNAETAVKNGKHLLVLTDQYLQPNQAPMPMILAIGAIHTHLMKKGLRSHCSLSVSSGECLDVHYFSVLIGVGATLVNPYLAEESINHLHAQGALESLTLSQAIYNYRQAVNQGLLKIMAKSGISVLSSYQGGYNFEALGLSRSLVTEFFPGLPAKISGIGLFGLQNKIQSLLNLTRNFRTSGLPFDGLHKFKTSGEIHNYTHDIIKILQAATEKNSYGIYKSYVKALQQQPHINLRDLLTFQEAPTPTPIESVESITSIRKYLLTPSMSMGALSEEAHETLNIAMNRIGSKSASGEGGEDPERYQPRANGDNANSAIKQVASARFGVNIEYLLHCQEIEIKMAQGAKPGEGGQLLGIKVTPKIAQIRHATPGVTLISPPPHHDIYSIEDLAQLIYDLKQVNDQARICVKLVARSGIGTIAAGVAKANADIICISGYNGGTGASAISSLTHAGNPWEMGLSEVHQVLTLNGLRHRVKLRVDGGIKCGRDVVIGTLLGGEEFNLGTVSLITLGCLMVRQCQNNICPVGICTQDANLRRNFTGTPDKVINLFSLIAEEIREIISKLGFKRLDDLIGMTDLLKQINRGHKWLDDLDLNPLLIRVKSDHFPTKYSMTKPHPTVDTIDAQIIKDAGPLFERGEKMQLTYNILNTHRTVGTKISSRIAKHFGNNHLADGHVTINLRGSAGQSLGAFATHGVKLIVAGDANDYVGKGLSGGQIVVHPFSSSPLRSNSNVIIGNTVLYGATAGTLFAAGIAGERFAVRNSGADTVVEGCGANGCEYMTGGTVVILGDIGFNFAAGMTGGMAFIYNPLQNQQDKVNMDTVLCQPVAHDYWNKVLFDLILQHAHETHSRYSAMIAAKWDTQQNSFWQICPKEMVPHLLHPLNPHQTQSK